MGLHAARRPRGIPRSTERMVPRKAMLRVGSRRGAMRIVTGYLLIRDVPRSPRNRLPIHLANCTRTGSFSPNSSRRASSCSRVASSSIITPTASPAATCIRKKDMAPTRKTMGTVARSRLIRYFCTLQHSSPSGGAEERKPRGAVGQADSTGERC